MGKVENGASLDNPKTAARTGWLSLVEAKLGIVSGWLSVVAGVFLVIMMMLDVADVAGRYFFLHPIKGTYEIVALFLIIAGTWGMASAEFKKSHVRVDLVTKRLSKGLQKALDVFGHLVVVFVLMLITWQMFARAVEYFAEDKGGKSLELGIAYGPFFILFGIGVGMFLISIIVHLLGLINSFRGAEK